ncbi:CGNR zinc finger domain-containing protein [Streptacidiphilus jiangxiensis]|uniref:CGNR zinc finger domain-containing protein n=1 Tax=Streptacidiphilus jiangxiensis TaxID=235985 RepID=A0A1H7S8J0_STRJI|nr:CGNR zinc finger domain-containing protein [Streptacidiphilus jiangxiensis]SEL68054.1 CGNR zinc finger domain-containing protein [Streptacidiphilus jiangxiensis]
MGDAPEPLRLVQDLVNTLDVESGVDGLEAFVGPGVDLPRARVFRELLRDVCAAHAGLDVPERSLGIFTRQLALAPLVLVPQADGSAELAPAPGLSPTELLFAQVAVAVAGGGKDWLRLKACAADSCRWLYYDRSPAGRGRWCSMAVCGSRAKMRAYRARGNVSAVPSSEYAE